MRILYIISTLIIILSSCLVAQEIDIIPELKKIESGEIEEAREVLAELKLSSPNDPSVIFLDAVITEDGESALEKYESIYNNFPKSKFADASLYRIFSYYYALGIYKKAESFRQTLVSEYPGSPYIKAVNRKLPDIELSNEEREIKQEEIISEPVKKVDVVESANFTVQAGAFLNIENAMQLKSNLEKSGYPVEITPKDVGGTTLNVVTVGKFDNNTAAEAFLVFLKTKHLLNGRIISLNQ